MSEERNLTEEFKSLLQEISNEPDKLIALMATLVAMVPPEEAAEEKAKAVQMFGKYPVEEYTKAEEHLRASLREAEEGQLKISTPIFKEAISFLQENFIAKRAGA